MAVVRHAPRTATLTVAAEIERLQQYIQRMETRYERTTESVVAAVARGELKETAEIGRWLGSYSALMNLKGEPAPGNEDGSLTPNTRSSIRAAWSRLPGKGSSTAKR